MYLHQTAQEAYRKVDFEARVAGTGPRDLVALCFEQLHTALGTALWAHERRDNAVKSQALTRALAALSALELGVAPEAPLARDLLLLYRSGRATLLANVPHFDAARVKALRSDLAEVARAFADA
jgi:flagellar protein FliS